MPQFVKIPVHVAALGIWLPVGFAGVGLPVLAIESPKGPVTRTGDARCLRDRRRAQRASRPRATGRGP